MVIHFSPFEALYLSIEVDVQGSYRSGKTAKSQRICAVREKYYFSKVRENDLGSCRLQISVIFCVSKC